MPESMASDSFYYTPPGRVCIRGGDWGSGTGVRCFSTCLHLRRDTSARAPLFIGFDPPCFDILSLMSYGSVENLIIGQKLEDAT